MLSGKAIVQQMTEIRECRCPYRSGEEPTVPNYVIRTHRLEPGLCTCYLEGLGGFLQGKRITWGRRVLQH